jgi:hypothetical protein
MGLRGLFDTLTNIAAQPEKDFDEMTIQQSMLRGFVWLRGDCAKHSMPSNKQNGATLHQGALPN